MGEFNRFDSEESSDVREYSKEQHQDERDESAAEIRDKRSGYFERQKKISSQMSETEPLVAEKERNIEQVATKIKELEDYIGQKSERLYSKLLHFLKLKKKRQELSAAQVEHVTLATEAREINGLLDELNQQKLDTTELDEARKTLDRFYAEQSVKWQEFQEDRRASDVKNICRDYGCFMVHAITPGWTPGNNSLMNNESSWEDKLRVFLSLEPSVSASTVHTGDNANDNLWSRMGLILSGGKVALACKHDFGTVAVDAKTRVSAEGWIDKRRRIGSLVRDAVHDRAKNSYNEFVVKDPEIAGFFVCLDEYNNDMVSKRKTQRPVNEVEPVLQELGIPLYAMKEGRIYSYARNSQGTFECGSEIAIEDIMQSRYDIDGHRDEILEQIFHNQALKAERIASNDWAMANCYIFGKGEFVRLFSKNLIKSGQIYQMAHETYRNQGQENGNHIETGQEIVPLKEISSEDREYFILLDNHCLYERTKIPNGLIVVNLLYSPDENNTITSTYGSIRLGTPSGAIIEGMPITDYETYFQFMTQIVQNRVDEMNDFRQKSEDQYEAMHKSEIKGLCYHLYGFADAAAKWGVEDIAQEARHLAATQVPVEEYQMLVRKRLDENDHFRLNREDVGVD